MVCENMQDEFSSQVDAIYRYVCRMDDATRSRERIARRTRELTRAELLGPEHAQLYDLNRVVSTAVAEAAPICQSLGVRVRLWQAIDLPRVPLLLEPLQHMMAGLIDLCLDDEDASSLELRTASELDRVVAQIDRYPRVRVPDPQRTWTELPLGARLELIVGAQAVRMLGGRMIIRHRGSELQARIELRRADSRLPLGNALSRPRSRRYPTVIDTLSLS